MRVTEHVHMCAYWGQEWTLAVLLCHSSYALETGFFTKLEAYHVLARLADQ